ncbi:MAG: TrkA family potassium uptake protein [Chloroflexota bacterium]|nr:TrkA family potassium uptake protein [Chloroflexota bacterium]PLS78461.1 MAG: potassium transporter TrkA [Chloroflexota bacterium]
MNILIVGGGKVGMSLADMLSVQGHQVTIIEMRDAVFTKMQRSIKTAQHIYGDGCNPSVLRDAGVESMDAVVAVTGDDEDNLVVAKLAKHEYHVGRVIARVNNPKNEWLFTSKMGVDIAISHAALLARIIHEELSMGDLVPLLKLSGGQISLAEVTVPPESTVIGGRVDALKLPAECVLATLVRKGTLLLPRGDTTIEPGDKIIALVKSEQQAELVRLFG